MKGTRTLSSGGEGLVVTPEAFDDPRCGLRDDADRASDGDHHEDDHRDHEYPQDRGGDERCVVHGVLLVVDGTDDGGRAVDRTHGDRSALGGSARCGCACGPGVAVGELDLARDLRGCRAARCRGGRRGRRSTSSDPLPGRRRLSSGGRRKRMNSAAAAAAMITCTHTGTPIRSVTRPTTLPKPQHEEGEIQREHLDDEEDGDQDQPADPSPLVDERDECREGLMRPPLWSTYHAGVRGSGCHSARLVVCEGRAITAFSRIMRSHRDRRSSRRIP